MWRNKHTGPALTGSLLGAAFGLAPGVCYRMWNLEHTLEPGTVIAFCPDDPGHLTKQLKFTARPSLRKAGQFCREESRRELFDTGAGAGTCNTQNLN